MTTRGKIQTQGVHHITLVGADRQTSIDFSERVLGMPFAADLPAADAAFMADSQVAWGVDALGGAVTEPGWRSKPNRYLVATDDRMIPPSAQRTMSGRIGATLVEVPGSHSIYVSRPDATAELIRQAAQLAAAETRAIA